MNSPYVNQIGRIDNDNMYVQAQKEQVPFSKWYNWISAAISSKYGRRHRKGALSTPTVVVKRTFQTKAKANPN